MTVGLMFRRITAHLCLYECHHHIYHWNIVDCDVIWTCSRLGPMFVYKKYLTWNSNRTFKKSHPKCTTHFWNHCVLQFCRKRKITLKFFNYNLLFCLFSFSSNAASSYIPSTMSFKMVVPFKVIKVGFIRPMYKVWDKNEMVKQTSPIVKKPL